MAPTCTQPHDTKVSRRYAASEVLASASGVRIWLCKFGKPRQHTTCGGGDDDQWATDGRPGLSYTHALLLAS